MDSPSTTNYFQGTGYALWTPTGGVQRDLGNIVECELTPSVDKLEHKKTRGGSKKTDFTQYNNQAVQIRIVLDEVTAENLAIELMSQVVENTDGTKTIRLMSVSTITGALEFIGDNNVGNKVHGVFPSVSFGPSGSFSPISGDDFGQLEITGDLLAITYTDGITDFGQMTVTEAA
ncbi:MAG: hypothetical protein E5Y10_22230 [Mesorhizobium sp.]|uniref:hypothetical protein n=1 Tax=Mesorhizobium sp. TaxID=1871066 RepID=UPI00120AD763|nr:hypothetical protein [Mesorhizobium sp.]TIN36848.1 MAG: hypothetical protein E5Y13_22840 [Mesorhizobium sp.]TJU81360.1 MAG: hypothetical protein E5Y15_21240 [Mesorhizobium sp.]TJU86693.1 MAG: hypothetical protein E5Y10_22230 [Mesorhizobium sp.]